MAFIKMDKLATSLFIALQIARWTTRILVTLVKIPITWLIDNLIRRGGIGVHRHGTAALEAAWNRSRTFRKRYKGKHFRKIDWRLAA